MGLKIESETHNDFLMMCPFHRNSYTPAFSISKTKGNFICFSGSCGVAGSLEELVMTVLNKNQFAARRIIMKMQGSQQDFAAELAESFAGNKFEFERYSQETLDRLHAGLLESDRAKEYMQGRGFELETLKHFEIGFSAKKDMICVPVHDPNGMPIGFIGRSVEGKRFKNTDNLPKSKTVWNIHRARKFSDTIILTEASFDAMRVHQSGFPNVGALLGGNISKEQTQLIQRNFTSVIIMTDNDQKKFNDNCRKCSGGCKGHQAGLELGMQIASSLKGLAVSWAATEFQLRFPEGAKDAGDLTDQQIKHMIKSAVSHFEFMQWR